MSLAPTSIAFKHKLPISAVVVTRNEAKHLRECLLGISYCEEIIVVDLQSTDDSVNIAKELGARVINHEPVPFIEKLHVKLGQWVAHKWILITDPDEVADPVIKNYIMSEFECWASNSELGCVRAPMIYYVGKREVFGTTWGPSNRSRVYLVHVDRYEFSDSIHRGRSVKSGFNEYYIDRKYGVLHHYWVESLSELVSKCRRYLKHENESSERSSKSLFEIMKLSSITFYSSFFVRKGYRDGWMGFALTVILIWYTVSSEIRRRGKKE